MDIIVGKGIVPLLAGPPVDAVAAHLADDILGIVNPVLLDIALGQPSSRLAVDGRLCGIEAAHIGEGRGSLVERTLMKLRASHQHPCFPEEGVVFLPVEPFDVFLRSFVLLEFRTALDAVQLDGFLALLDGSLVVAFAQLASLFVAHGIERNHLCEVVLDAILLFDGGIDIGQRAIIIGIIFSEERVPPSRLCRILLGRAGHE